MILNPVVTPYDKKNMELLSHEIEHIAKELKREYETPYGALVAPADAETFTLVNDAVASVKKLNPDLLVLVGIGGSNMGTLAILQALGYTAQMQFMSADTIDERYTTKLLAQFRTALQAGQVPIVCIVTKSGTTAETIINGSLFIELLKEQFPDTYHEHVVIISDKGSALADVAQKEGYRYLSIPKQVGGRYSVFTAVGLFPLSLLGVDVQKLCRGAQDALLASLDPAIEVNPAALTALSLYEHYRQGYYNHVLFMFSPYLVLLGHWYKQLIGESLGKKETEDGTLVETGFTPLVSLGTTDLHSVAQLYLSGPRNTITSFIYFDDEEKRIVVPSNNVSELLTGMPGRPITEVKSAILQGTIEAYSKEKRPSIVLPLEQKAEHIGTFMLSKMVETMLLGRLFAINPFDQPGVELYKKETREYLKKTDKAIG